MNRLPPETEEQLHLWIGGARGARGPGPVARAAGMDHRPRVPAVARSRSRRRPDYRLRGLELDVYSPPDAPLPDVSLRPARTSRARRRRNRRLLFGWLVALSIATAVAVPLRLFVVQPFTVPTAGMVPTFQVGDQILVVKPTLLTGTIARGDIVVFKHPTYFPCRAGGTTAHDLVTRIVGLPGETIWSTGNTVYVDRHRLDERGWYDADVGPVGSTPILRTTVPRGEYFTMGDNRADACDSRSFGVIPGSSIVGKVVAVLLRNGHPHVHIL